MPVQSNFPRSLPQPQVDPLAEYEALIQAHRARMAQPQAPMYSPEEQEARQTGNERDYALGLLGSLSGGRAAGNVGGTVFKNALAARQPRVSERGSADQITGKFTYNPDYLAEKQEAELGRLQTGKAELARRIQEDDRRSEDRRQAAADRRAYAGSNEPLVQVFDPATGEVTYKPRSQAAGMQAPPKAGAGGKMPAEIQRMSIAFGALKNTIGEYEDALKDFNPRNPLDQANPTKRAKIDSIQQRVRLEAKEAAALGALQAPDLALLDKMLANPSGMSGAGYGREGLSEQTQQMRNWIGLREEQVQAQFPSFKPLPPRPRLPAGQVNTGTAEGSWGDEPAGGVIDFNALPPR